jgi:hypothetical protein
VKRLENAVSPKNDLTFAAADPSCTMRQRAPAERVDLGFRAPMRQSHPAGRFPSADPRDAWKTRGGENECEPRKSAPCRAPPASGSS